MVGSYDKITKVTDSNNFAISSDGIATALQDSASSLVAANNSYEQAVALIASANRVVQDPNSVGAALRTISLRLRGTSVEELEEAGEDTTGAITSKSKLRSKVKGLSGVDILTDSGAYKDTYTILLEISKVWEDMSDIDQAALLEVIAGKTRSNTAAAILSNTVDLEEAYVQALGAEGSALRENEKYLDSIQGKIDLFNNAVQTMWSNELDSSWVKSIVEFGTALVKIIDKIGLLPSILGGVLIYMTAFKKNNPITMIKDIGAYFVNAGEQAEKYGTALGVLNAQKQAQVMASKGATQQEIVEQLVTQKGVDAKNAEVIAERALTMAKQEKTKVTGLDLMIATAEQKLTLSDTALTWLASQAEEELTKEKLKQAVADGHLTQAEYKVIMAKYASLGATNSLKTGIKGLTATIKASFASNPIGWILAIVSAVITLVTWLSNLDSKAEKLAGKLDDLNSEITSLESKMESLNSELETTQERMTELLSMDSLSFAEQEELNNLRATNAELERQVTLQKKLLGYKQNERVKTIEGLIDEKWHSKGRDKQYRLAENFSVLEDVWWDSGDDTDSSFKKSLAAYNSKEIYEQAKKELEENGRISEETFVEMRKAHGTDPQTAREFYNSKSRLDDSYYLDEYYHDIYMMVYELKDGELKRNADMEKGIDMVLSELAGFILEEDLSYGMSDEIDAFLDEYYAYTYQWDAIRGKSSKAQALEFVFDDTASDEIQKLEKEIQNIVNDESLSLNEQNKEIQKIINSVDMEDEAYHRLATTMEIVGLNAEEIAQYYTMDSITPTYNTVEDKIKEFEKITPKLSELLSEATTYDFVGPLTEEQQQFANLFDKEGIVSEAAVAEYFGPMSDETRKQISKLVQDIYDGEVDVETALKQFELFGVQSTLEIQIRDVKTNFKDVFVDLEDADGFINTFEELGEAVSSAASALDVFNQAQKEMSHSGYVSVETALQLMEYTDDYSSVLTVVDGKLKLAEGAEKALIQSRLDALKISAETSLAEAQNAYDKAQTAFTTYKAAMVSDKSAQTVAKSQDKLVAKAYAFVQAVKGIFSGESWTDAYNNAYESKLSEITGYETEYTDAGLQVYADQLNDAETKLKEAQDRVNFTAELSAENLESVFDSGIADGSDKTTKEKEIDDAWEKLVNKYENELALITNERDLIEAEIDKMEATGGKASAQYYKDLIRNSNEERDLLIDKKKVLGNYLKDNKNNVDQDTWTEMNNEINETAVAIKECTTNLLEYYDVLEEIDSHYFEQAMDDVARLGEEIEFVQGLLEDEEVADENGNWTSAGITRMGLYVNEMERAAASAESYKQDINNVDASWREYQKLLKDADGNVDAIPTEALNELNDKYGYVITSEEEYKEKTDELTDSMYSEIEAYEAAKDGIVDLNKARVDAIKKGIEKEIEAFEDYIDVVKEALDAERDLYEFKKDISKQTKDITSLERRISALSGATDSASVAERRKLEAELLEAKEGLNDTYYNHAKDQQSQALDNEAEAFKESKDRYIEELESTLDDVGTLIENSMMDVLFNADIIYEELAGPGGIADTYGIQLSNELTQPWKDTSDQAIKWKNELQKMMTSGEYAKLIGKDGAITVFANGVGNKLQGSWDKAKGAVKNYADYLTGEELGKNFGETITGFGDQIQTIIDKWNDVKKAAEEAYDTQNRVLEVGGQEENTPPPVGNPQNSGDKSYLDKEPKDSVKALQKILNEVYLCALKEDGIWGSATSSALRKVQKLIKVNQTGKYDNKTAEAIKKDLDSRIASSIDNKQSDYKSKLKNAKKNLPVAFHATGTLGTKKDEWAITDEPWLGDELVLVPGKDGNLQYMRKGTGVIPADITANLVEWGKLNPDMMSVGNGMANLNMINNAVNKPEFNLTFDALVKAEKITEDTLPELKKFVTQEINSLVKQMNYAIKGYAR